MKRILLLGATGSIGQQTIDIIDQHTDMFKLVGICAGHQAKKMQEILNEHPEIEVVGLSREDVSFETTSKVFLGNDCMEKCIQNCEYDILVNAVVGFRGLIPTLLSLQNNKDVALANKESLVAGGTLVSKVLKHSRAKIYPIDSEHSAIFQCLQGNDKKNVARLIITASGGSFRDKTRDQLENVTVEETLNHPNWSMGKRITVDSATMVNKGFEVLEAHYLFDLDFEHIDVVLHKESIIHSMVEYQDHAVMAQLGSADMRLPIQYALCYPDRPYFEEEHPLDMTKTMNLHFKEMDFERYPMLRLAYEVGKKGGNLGAVFNGADEAAVELFLNHKISFLDIETSIEKAIQNVDYVEDPTLEELIQADYWARQFVNELWQ